MGGRGGGEGGRTMEGFLKHLTPHLFTPLPPSLPPSPDECKECEWSTLNLGQQGEGRIAVSWMAIACDTGGTPVSYLMVVSRESGKEERGEGRQAGGKDGDREWRLCISLAVISLRIN